MGLREKTKSKERRRVVKRCRIVEMHQERAGNKGAVSRSNRKYKKGKTEEKFKSQNREIRAKKE